MRDTGRIIILNGAPRAGKSSIARAIQETAADVWVNLGVDAQIASLPARFRPGIGLRPGGEHPELEELVPALYAALYESIASHARLGLNVVTDVGHHDAYSRPMNLLSSCARRLSGLRALFVGVHCPIETVMARRATSGGDYVTGAPADPLPDPVRHWQSAVHRPGIYDLEVDTSCLSTEACAAKILTVARLEAAPPSAFERLADLSPN